MLKIQSDRVIIDGHEPTKEQCETMTLLANALAESNNFKTVEYRDGYAEFEKVGKADELKFKPSATELTIIFDSNITSVSCIDSLGVDFVWSSSGETLAIGSGGYITFTVLCKEGYELSSVMKDGSEVIISNNTFTVLLTDSIATITLTSKQATSKVSVDLTTLPGWSALSSGTHNITIVAKAAGYRDSESSAAVSVEKAAAMPNKGDIITLDSKQYRVLKTEGTVAEVLAMYDANSSIKFDGASSGSNNTYAGKSLDTYCNNTFYSGLSAAMKSAIVDKTFTQDSWEWSSSVPTESHYTGIRGASYYYLTLVNAAYGSSITRHCYCLSVQDVLDYLEATTSMGTSDITLTDTNIWQMFWNATTSQSGKYIWLRSARSSDSDFAFFVGGGTGYLDKDFVGAKCAARPAFQIDLSKVEWSK